MRIVDAPNTHSPSIIALEALGFTVTIIPCDEEDELGLWHGERGDLEIEAGDPLALLGLAALVLVRGADWRKTSDAKREQEIIESTYPQDE